MSSTPSKRLWTAIRLLAVILVLGYASRIKSQEPEVRRAVVVEDTDPTAAPPPATPEPEKPSGGAVDAPSLTRYARLWTDSLFTTRALPAPEAPKGPTFADNLSLSGTYEMNGKMVAILIDKTTSGVLEAYIGEENDAGIRISKVEPGATPDKIKLQLQKGSEVGWVSFADMTVSGDDAMNRPMTNGAQSSAPGRPVIPPPIPVPMPQASPPQQSQPPVVQVPVVQQPAPVPPVTQMNSGMPQAVPQVPDDVPLPPP
ncbi:MAG: hypothetical protein JNJ83_17920 [Verrucomicrobiaceae bacterium]|nr:hypothetical protein [Verrucomicrobiaceae bacterium]